MMELVDVHQWNWGAFYTGKTVALEPSHQLNCYVSAYYHDSDISNNISQAIKIITLTRHLSYIEGIKFFMLKICLFDNPNQFSSSASNYADT